MVLWSKGLGKLVLKLRLSERSGMSDRDGNLAIEGTMGPPTFWNYAVTLQEKDVVDFIGLLQKPAPVRFLVAAPRRWEILKAALAGALSFLWRTLYRLFGGAGGANEAGGAGGANEAGGAGGANDAGGAAAGDAAPIAAGAGEPSANEPQARSSDGGN
jgi:hypothetical protein